MTRSRCIPPALWEFIHRGRARIEWICWQCGKTIRKGDWCFRMMKPDGTTNNNYRSRTRLCTRCKEESK